ncbi:MAG TPA: hypothetical protein VEG44_04065 [Candidatus Acidoferrales bacterium]|nr:hypothetical protein [Candidatus Acidoferrales bacterium]
MSAQFVSSRYPQQQRGYAASETESNTPLKNGIVDFVIEDLA